MLFKNLHTHTYVEERSTYFMTVKASPDTYDTFMIPSLKKIKNHTLTMGSETHYNSITMMQVVTIQDQYSIEHDQKHTNGPDKYVTQIVS